MLVSEAQGKDTKAGYRMLSVTYTVIEGRYERRKVFKNFLIGHPKVDVSERAWSDWRYFLEALGADKPYDYESQALQAVRDKILLLKVGHEKDKETGELKERVNDFMPDGDINGRPDVGDSTPPPSDMDIPF